MKLGYDDSVEVFREEFLAWLAENRPAQEEMLAEPAVSSAHRPGWSQRWARRMFDDGWLVPGWPPELGGRDAGPIETLVYLEELNSAGVPRTTNPQGLGIVAPSLLDYGNEAQIGEYAMPLLRGETTACLGMSEPEAGSDLANLKTRAVLDGEQFIINGQKVWTSGAAYADFCFLFCRTDPDVPKHKGISIVLLPMDTAGVTVRPLKEIVHPDFPDVAEVFLEDVVLPTSNLVGEMNNGWRMANGSLAHERSMVWLGAVMEIERSMQGLLAMLPGVIGPMGSQERAVAADEAVGLYIDTQAVRCLGYRGFARFLKDGSAPEQALMKLYASETRQRMALTSAELVGPHSLVTTQSRRSPVGTLEDYFETFAGTISAGSSEIQRNIIAERVLGLPRS
jgi:alkylation response protein AidB-like acyl-CoA dehydrogenase